MLSQKIRVYYVSIMITFGFILLASLFISFISFSGAILLVWKHLFRQRLTTYFVSFAAGILLSIAFLEILPEAIAGKTEVSSIFLSTLLGIVAFFFLERFVLWFHHHDNLHGAKPSAFLILVGDGVHNVVDGVAIAAAFLTSPSLGLTTTLAIAAHEVPQEIADFSVLVAGGMHKTKALWYNFLSGLTALIGAIAGFYFLEHLQNVLSIALAFTAGMFIYIACSDLIPDLHQDFKQRKNWMQSLPFVLGMVTAWVMVQFLK